MIYLIIILILIFVSYKLIGIHTRDIEINRLTIKNKKIKEELNILHLSDFHFNFDKKYQEKLLNMINKLEYDLLVLTGDYLIGEDYLINLEQFLKKLITIKRFMLFMEIMIRSSKKI